MIELVRRSMTGLINTLEYIEENNLSIQLSYYTEKTSYINKKGQNIHLKHQTAIRDFTITIDDLSR